MGCAIRWRTCANWANGRAKCRYVTQKQLSSDRPHSTSQGKSGSNSGLSAESTVTSGILTMSFSGKGEHLENVLSRKEPSNSSFSIFSATGAEPRRPTHIELAQLQLSLPRANEMWIPFAADRRDWTRGPGRNTQRRLIAAGPGSDRAARSAAGRVRPKCAGSGRAAAPIKAVRAVVCATHAEKSTLLNC